MLEQLVKDDPNNLEALEANARLLLLVNDPAGALQAATTLQTLQPKSPKGYFLAGAALQAQQRSDEARKAFETALQLDPASLDSLIALAQIDLAAGKQTEALARIDAQIAARPNEARLYNLRGELLMALKRPADAASSYAAAAKLQPGWSQPYRGEAAAFAVQNQPDRAIEVLKAGLAQTKNSADLAVDLGSLYTAQGKPAEAITVYEGVLERDPNSVVAANNLAMLLVTHRTDAASLERAEKLAAPLAKAQNPAFLDTYGWVLYKRGRYAEAIPPLEKAVAAAPQAQEVRYHLGMAQLKAGRTAEARKSLEAAVQGEQSYAGKDEAKAALAGM